MYNTFRTEMRQQRNAKQIVLAIYIIKRERKKEKRKILSRDKCKIGESRGNNLNNSVATDKHHRHPLAQPRETRIRIATAHLAQNVPTYLQQNTTIQSDLKLHPHTTPAFSTIHTYTQRVPDLPTINRKQFARARCVLYLMKCARSGDYQTSVCLE